MSLARRVVTLVILAGLVSVGYGRRDKKEDEPFLLVVGVVAGSIADEFKIQEGDVLRTYRFRGSNYRSGRRNIKLYFSDRSDGIVSRAATSRTGVCLRCGSYSGCRPFERRR